MTFANELALLRILHLRKGQRLNLLTIEETVELAAVSPDAHLRASAFLLRAKTAVARDRLGTDIDPFVLRCESPAEVSMLHGLTSVTEWIVDMDIMLRTPAGTWAKCVPQWIAAKRRIDFAFFVDGKKLAVEVDGYAFHYATSELADATLSRRRELIADGWQVLPFTASEVFRDASSCARQVLSLLGEP